jgi:chaperonin GroES
VKGRGQALSLDRLAAVRVNAPLAGLGPACGHEPHVFIRLTCLEVRPLATASATKINLKPLADRVVVKKVEAEEKTAGGIVLPDTAKEKPQQGEVLAVGPGRLDEKGARMPMELSVGDRVLFAKYSGTEVKIEGVEYLLLAERDILAIVG